MTQDEIIARTEVALLILIDSIVCKKRSNVIIPDPRLPSAEVAKGADV